jgi:ferredoxin
MAERSRPFDRESVPERDSGREAGTLANSLSGADSKKQNRLVLPLSREINFRRLEARGLEGSRLEARVACQQPTEVCPTKAITMASGAQHRIGRAPDSDRCHEPLLLCNVGSGGLPLSAPREAAPTTVADQIAAHGCHDRIRGGGLTSPTRPTARPLRIPASRLRKQRGQVSPPGVLATNQRSQRRPGWRSPSDKAADDVGEYARHEDTGSANRA